MEARTEKIDAELQEKLLSHNTKVDALLDFALTQVEAASRSVTKVAAAAETECETKDGMPEPEADDPAPEGYDSLAPAVGCVIEADECLSRDMLAHASLSAAPELVVGYTSLPKDRIEAALRQFPLADEFIYAELRLRNQLAGYRLVPFHWANAATTRVSRAPTLDGITVRGFYARSESSCECELCVCQRRFNQELFDLAIIQLRLLAMSYNTHRHAVDSTYDAGLYDAHGDSDPVTYHVPEFQQPPPFRPIYIERYDESGGTTCLARILEASEGAFRRA
jgi:hypothetical protein